VEKMDIRKQKGTIKMDEAVKKELEKLKISPHEPYYIVIKRLIDATKSKTGGLNNVKNK